MQVERPHGPAPKQSNPVADAGILSGDSKSRRPRGAAIQPGLLPLLRLYIVVSAILPVFNWRLMDSVLGIRGPLLKVLRTDIVFFVVLITYTSLPWFRDKMGRAS